MLLARGVEKREATNRSKHRANCRAPIHITPADQAIRDQRSVERMKATVEKVGLHQIFVRMQSDLEQDKEFTAR